MTTKPPELKPSVRLTVVLTSDGQNEIVARVQGIDSTYIRVSVPNLNVPKNATLDLELFDDVLRMNVAAVVEDCDPFGFTGRLVQPTEIFKHWIALIGK